MAVPALGLFAIFHAILAWLLREVVLKFVVLAVIYGALAVLAPLVVFYASEAISPGALTTAFAAIPAGVWFFWDLLGLTVGLPLVISAYVSRFMIRRIPIVG